MIVGVSWSSFAYVYGEEKRRAEVRFDLGLAAGVTPRTHQTCVRLVVQGADAGEALEAFEQGLHELLDAVDCMLVGVLRYGATLEFVFQVQDLATFASREEALVARAPGVAALHRSAGWDFFTDRVCPQENDWQRIADREAAERLVASGLDPAALHPIEHRFVGDEERLGLFEAELLAAGFEPPTTEPGRMRVVRRQTLGAEALSEVSVALGTACRRLGIVYDGWRLAR